MRISLKWKVAGGYGALTLAMLLGLGAYAGHVTERHMIARLRESLAVQCRLVRALIADRDPDTIPAVVEAVAAATDARITIIAPDGTVLADTEADPLHMDPHNTRTEVVEAVERGIGSAIRHSATLNVEMLYVAQSAGPGLPVVRLALPLAAVRQASAGLRRSIILGAAIAAVVAILFGTRLTARLTQSLGEVARVARRLGEGDLAARAQVPDADEVRDLAEALAVMAEGLGSAQAELARQATELHAILAQMADGVIVVRPDETVRMLNRAAGEMLGISPAEAVGKRLVEVVLHFELVELARRALRLRTPVDGEVVTGETQRILAATATTVDSGKGGIAGAVITLRDVTERRRLEQVRRDFVANASHELRTPVAAIRSLAEALIGGAMADPQVAERFLSQIVTNTENLTRLLDDLLVLARLEAAEYRPQPQLLSVRAELAAAAARLEPQAGAKDIALDVDAPEDLCVWCAEQNLQAALVNLVDNAVKYTPQGGRVTLRGEASNGQVRLSVTDTGPGIPEKDRERVFERFYRVDKARSRALGGTGLGLSIVKHAVETSGGRVWVEAPPEGGARFVVMLPAGPP